MLLVPKTEQPTLIGASASASVGKNVLFYGLSAARVDFQLKAAIFRRRHDLMGRSSGKIIMEEI